MPATGQQQMERRVEDVLADALPDVDLLELTVLPAQGGILRLVVDHPSGVDHGVCAAVTGALEEAGLLEEYGAEVWSPGPEPPLRTPEHFRRAVGRRINVVSGDAGGTRSRTGTLVRAGDTSLELALALEDEVVEIPLSAIRRANAFEDVGAQS